MDVVVDPRPLAGQIPAVASKSDAHRLLICAALADGPTELGLQSLSQDILATMDCLKALGADIRQTAPNRWQIAPIQAPASSPVLDCGESGSTLRFLLPLVGALGAETAFQGRGRLPQRPLTQLTEQLEVHGMAFSAPTLPFSASGRLTGGLFRLPGGVSSQFVTGLLLCAPLLEEGCRVEIEGNMESAPYVDLTVSAMERFGVAVQTFENSWQVLPGQAYRSPGSVQAQGDWSNAAFWLCAGALDGRGVAVTGLDLASPQGDKAVLNILTRMGAQVRWQDGVAQVSPGPLRGAVVDAAEIPDLIPALSIVAACAQGETQVIHAGRLRLKESDRLTACASLIRALGGQAEELPEGLIIQGGGLTGGRTESFGDHRIAMAAAAAACACRRPVTICGAQAADKSYPAFWADYQTLGGSVHELHVRS
ncbi:MAG: 3-phosphoshikimate 1-carboxyvinyltransferase [Clostridiaceae bacterium]|jgi:3-phosphoshikimate 1-carboxyvinyltransferase|nr:3-phosphoshikimate 1-carboxyvinyltransferase [Clostridiaceae bacterium]